jgi:uncharacterized protein YbjT (DUF2867 family)
MKTAVLLGATGMVGTALLNQLIADQEYAKIIAIVRKPLKIEHSKIEQQVIDFDKPESYRDLVKGDVLFSSFGTTKKKAGSKENQYKIDFTYQYEIAEAGAANGIKNYVLVSSAGADSNSSIFYSRIKGELDQAVRNLNFDHVTILRPSMLDGDRNEKRTGEQIGLKIMNVLLPWLPYFKKYRPIHAAIVAKAMLNSAGLAKDKYRIYELEQIFELAIKI